MIRRKIYTIFLLLLLFVAVVSIELDIQVSLSKDYFMDSQFMNIIRHFSEEGYQASNFKNVLTGGPLNHPDSIFYNNFGNFHQLFYGLFFKAGFRNVIYYRYISVFISLMALACLFVIILKLTSNIFVAALSIMILLLFHQFHFYLDHLWLAPYTLFFSWAPAAVYLLGRDSKKLSIRTYFFLTAFILFIQMQITFDAVAYSYFLILSVHFYLYKSEKNPWKLYHIIGFSLAILLGFLFLVFWKHAVTGGNTLKTSLILSNMYNVAMIDIYKTAYYLLHPSMVILYVISFISIFILSNFRGDLSKKTVKISIIFFICGIFWFIMFPQHALRHSHLYVRMIIPPLALLSGTGLYIIFSQNRFVVYKSLVLLVLVLYVVINCDETIFRNKFAVKYDVSQYKEIGPLIDKTAVVYSNIWNYPFSYYADKSFRYVGSLNDFLADKDNSNREKYLLLAGKKVFLLNPNLLVAEKSIERYLNDVDVILKTDLTLLLRKQIDKFLQVKKREYFLLRERLEHDFTEIASIPVLGITLYSIP